MYIYIAKCTFNIHQFWENFTNHNYVGGSRQKNSIKNPNADQQQSHIPSRAFMLRNLCFLPLQTLQTTKNTLISPQVSLSKSFWVSDVLIRVMLCFGIKMCFCNSWAWGGLRRLTKTYHRWVKWHFSNHG